MVNVRQVRRTLYDIAVLLGLALCVTGLLLFPQQSVGAARNGLSLCFNVIIPSLFPFFVLSAMIVSLGYARRFGRVLEPVMRPLFNVGGPCSTAFVLGFIGGYPVGARTVIALYKSGACSKTEAERMLAFCNNSGPAFIFGVVGAGVFASSRVGLLLYLAHTAASICVGILFRSWGGKDRAGKEKDTGNTDAAPALPFTQAFTESVKSSFLSILNICGFVVFFTVLIRLLQLTGLIPALSGFFGRLGFDRDWAERLITGFIELTSGVATLRGASASLYRSMAAAAFMLGWAGLSVHAQVLSFIADSGLTIKTYFFGKLLHGLLSAVFASVLARLFVFRLPAGAYLAQQVQAMASLSFGAALQISCLFAALILIFFLIAARRDKIRRKNRRPASQKRRGR